MAERLLAPSVLWADSETRWAYVEKFDIWISDQDHWLKGGPHTGSVRISRSGYWEVRRMFGRRHESARIHVLVLTAFVGPRPEGNVTRHLNSKKTDNRLVNLAWGTQEQNMRDEARRRLDERGKQTHCFRGHPLTEDNLVKKAYNRRACKICTRAAQQRYRERKAAEASGASAK